MFIDNIENNCAYKFYPSSRELSSIPILKYKSFTTDFIKCFRN